MTDINSWGNYPKHSGKLVNYKDNQDLSNILNQENQYITRGNGRSYGDSALADLMLNTKAHDYFYTFDDNDGTLHVQSGAQLRDIILHFLPKGWFLKVTPGTKYVTVGGAIASDVHGKNHHIQGCFSECVTELRLMLANGDIKTCSRNENHDLFRATCGGMGLTGVILDAKIKLKKVNSQFINQTTIKTQNLADTFEAFESHQNATYSVAWIDCLAKGDNLGRSLLMLGDFSDDGDLDYGDTKKVDVPFNFPAFSLNKLSVSAFNWLYYNKVMQAQSNQKVSIDSFFYPLDSLANWNRIYGKKGFTQYQFILPKETSFKGLEAILKAIANAGKGSFLAVLKLYGAHNDNYLSFPMEGYSLALDFKIEDSLFPLLDHLDEITHANGGRVYLAKDCRLSQANFNKGYALADDFRQLRADYNMTRKFQSLQSLRLSI